MSTQIIQNTYITTGSCIMQTDEHSQLVYSPVVEFDETIKAHQGSNVILIAATAREPYKMIEKAYKRGIKVYFEADLIYDFNTLWDKKLDREQNLIKLLSIAREPVFLEVAVNILFTYLKHKIPLKMDLETVIALIIENVSASLNSANAITHFKSLYSKHLNEVRQFIAPDLNHPKIKVVPLSYQKELSDYLIHHDGLFVLNEPMAAGKTTHGIIPLFEHCANQAKEQALLIAPNIALTRSLQAIIIENDNVSPHDYQHYLDVLLSEPLNTEASLICCVNSATSKDKFMQQGHGCQTVLIDEIQTCLNVFSQRLIGEKKLSQSGKAMKHFFTLLNKPKVLIADALINELTMQHIIEQTGREVIILTNTDALPQLQKEVHLYEREEHIEQIITQASETRCEVGFCDGGQKLSTAYFDIAKVIENALKGEIKTVNADFLKTKEGGAFLQNPLSAINKAMFTLFSPAVTAGQNFPFEQFERTNILAHETISPSQLLQSTGRFRHAHLIQLSFVGAYRGPHHDADFIRKLEVWETTQFSEFADELEYVENDVFCQYIVERMVDENKLRQHYENNTLILFEHLGVNLVRKSHDVVTLPIPSKPTPFEHSTDIRPISRPKYQQLKQKSLFLTDEEKEQIYVFELFDFFNVLDKPELYHDVLAFDKTGKAREWITHLHLCRSSHQNKDMNTSLKLKQMVCLRVLRTLGIDSETLEGVYGYKDINKMEKFLRQGEIRLYGKALKMRRIKKALFNISHTQKPSVNKGAFAKAILGKLFGFEHEIAGRNDLISQGVYSYKITRSSKQKNNNYYGQKY